MKHIGLLLLFLTLGACTSSSKTATTPDSSTKTANAKSTGGAVCVEADTVRIWENNYCLVKSGADDLESRAFLKCHSELRKNTAVPTEKCDRIVWLKDRACADDPGSGRTRTSCLSDANYLKELEEAPYTGP